MNRIYYAGHSIVTGTAIAEGLLNYAQELAAVVGSATVQVPTLLADGTQAFSQFLIGPASQLLSVKEVTSSGEIVDEGLLSWMKQRVVALHRGAMPEPMSSEDFDWDDRWDGDH